MPEAHVKTAIYKIFFSESEKILVSQGLSFGRDLCIRELIEGNKQQKEIKINFEVFVFDFV